MWVMHGGYIDRKWSPKNNRSCLTLESQSNNFLMFMVPATLPSAGLALQTRDPGRAQ